MSMPAVTPQQVKQLRDRTDQPMGLCKQALDQNAGDMDKAIEWLRSQNSEDGRQARRERDRRRAASASIFDNAAKIAAIVEMRCESAPRPRATSSSRLANDMAKHVAVKNPGTVADALTQTFVGGGGNVQDRINDVVGVIREKMVLHKFQRLDGGVYGSYIHHDGTVGVLIECRGGSPNDELLRDVSAHIAALNPPYTTTEDVPADVMAKEKAAVMADIQADPKNASQAGQHPREDRRGQAEDQAGRDGPHRATDGQRDEVSEHERRRGPEQGRTEPGQVRPPQGRRRRTVIPSSPVAYGWASILTYMEPFMPHTASAWKRLRKNEKRKKQNRAAAKIIKVKTEGDRRRDQGRRRRQARRQLQDDAGGARPRRR